MGAGGEKRKRVGSRWREEKKGGQQVARREKGWAAGGEIRKRVGSRWLEEKKGGQQLA